MVSILPYSSKNNINKLIEYPGPLSTFSGKIELLYVFRIIDKGLYDSLHSLRKVRNSAAHTSDYFTLNENEDRIIDLLKFDKEFGEIIDDYTWNYLIEWKKKQLNKVLIKSECDFQIKKELYEEKLKGIKESPEIKEQFKIWRLSITLTFICLKILVLIDKYGVLKDKKITLLYYIENT